MTPPTIIYYKWAYSPTTGDVTLAHNHEGHPANVRFHADMDLERPERDLLHGYAYKGDGEWKVLDDDHRIIDDAHALTAITQAVDRDQLQRNNV